jgi:hypothetical protein
LTHVVKLSCSALSRRHRSDQRGVIKCDQAVALQDSRHRLWQVADVFENLDALNAWLERRCKELWSELRHPQRREFTIRELWEHERGTFMAAPSAFDGFVEHTKRLSPTCLVHFDRNRYSVPATFANRPISLRVYADRVVIATVVTALTPCRDVRQLTI